MGVLFPIQLSSQNLVVTPLAIFFKNFGRLILDLPNAILRFRIRFQVPESKDEADWLKPPLLSWMDLIMLDHMALGSNRNLHHHFIRILNTSHTKTSTINGSKIVFQALQAIFQ